MLHSEQALVLQLGITIIYVRFVVVAKVKAITKWSILQTELYIQSQKHSSACEGTTTEVLHVLWLLNDDLVKLNCMHAGHIHYCEETALKYRS